MVRHVILYVGACETQRDSMQVTLLPSMYGGARDEPNVASLYRVPEDTELLPECQLAHWLSPKPIHESLI